MASENSGCVGFFTAVGALLTAVWVGFQVYDEVKARLPENPAVVRADGEETQTAPSKEKSDASAPAEAPVENVEPTEPAPLENDSNAEASDQPTATEESATGETSAEPKEENVKHAAANATSEKEAETTTAKENAEEEEETKPDETAKKGFDRWESPTSRLAFAALLPITNIFGIGYVLYVGATCGQWAQAGLLTLHIILGFMGINAMAPGISAMQDEVDRVAGFWMFIFGAIIYSASTWGALTFVW